MLELPVGVRSTERMTEVQYTLEIWTTLTVARYLQKHKTNILCSSAKLNNYSNNSVSLEEIKKSDYMEHNVNLR